MYKIKFFQLKNGKEPVKEWLLSLDISIRVKIVKRIERIYDANFGTHKQLKPNLYELKFTIGKGYRIYYTIKNDQVVLLLNAGDKSQQSKDIAKAKEYLKEVTND